MTFAHLLATGGAFAAREAIVDGATTTLWGQLADLATGYVAKLGELAGCRVGLRLNADASSFAALAALDALATDAFLFDADLSIEETRALAEQLRLAAIVKPSGSTSGAPPAGSDLAVAPLSGAAAGSGASSVTILTSGTTGRPKAARHTWESLSRPVRRTSGNPPRWLLAYRPHLYAGLQVVLQCWTNGGTLVAPSRSDEPAVIANLMRTARTEFASATPSYWRRLLLFAPREILREAPLEQITLGGEAIDQQILDALGACFPAARIVHIYATTELGRCFSVTDGQAGFPLRYIEQPLADAIRLRIADGELLVRSANGMREYDGLAGGPPQPDSEWFHTGDLVEIVGERVHFVGRKSDIINVGGNKVHPLEVERVIRQVPGVADVRVYGKASSIAGQVVVCELAVGAADRAEVERAVAARCAAELKDYQRPRLYRFVERIELAASGKTTRSSAP